MIREIIAYKDHYRDFMAKRKRANEDTESSPVVL